MNEIERRTIEELTARYILEPNLRDIYVEGSNDEKLIKWFLKQNECTEVEVFTINCIDIKDDLIKKYKLQSGNRHRLIALSLELDRCLPIIIKHLECIVDSDFDFLLGRKYTSKYLLYTDYTCIELYFFSEKIIEKIFLLGPLKKYCSISELTKNLEEVLQEIFLIRTANEKLRWGLAWLGFIRDCKIENGIILFDKKKFIEKYLSKNNKLNRIDEFINTCEELKKIKTETCKQRIHGEDYIDLLGWYMSKICRKGGHHFQNQAVIRSIILQAADAIILTNEGMFKKLLLVYKDN